MKYGFIGCGNMGGALALALSKKTTDICIGDPAPKAKEFAEKLGLCYLEPKKVALVSDRLFLGVKPQMMEQVLSELSPALKEKKPLIITMAAGLSTRRICEMAGITLPIIRIMPNTPVAVNKGTVLYCSNGLVNEEDIKDFLMDMEFAGSFEAVPEELFDAAGTVSGCGPAYFYMMIEGLARGAEKCGVNREDAIKYAANTMLGAAQMVLSSPDTPETLKNNVCSKGGSTIEGVKVLEENGFYETITACIEAAYKRNKELGKN
ncbi:MAG: pyrroline-5-carboxylate reductase [Clostridia bacterium]|nr:pyrroline-5-carboxylate reductase [Clostridia bacterium]